MLREFIKEKNNIFDDFNSLIKNIGKSNNN